ncbi:MAG: surface carbohydrate biosynthesis protein [Alphaproteobacteria bacterium]
MGSEQEKWLYIPVEIKVREMPAKLLLAVAAAHKGYNVIFGRKAEITKYIHSMPSGIFLGFGAQKNFLSQYKDLKAKQFSICIMDEEGLVTFSDDMYKRMRLSDDTLEYVDATFTWGDKQTALLNKYITGQSPKIYTTGNLRFDILRKEFRHLIQADAQSINDRFGKIILINSSFGSCNHFDGKEKYFESLKTKKIITSQEDKDFYQKYFELKESVFNSYVESIPAIARAFKDYTVIIRPHPSENHNAWQNAAQGCDNVKIIHEGSVHPWLIASDVVIHHFCTTALEAFAAGTPAIAYRPFKDESIESQFVYDTSITAETVDEVITEIHTILSTDKTRIQSSPAALSQHIHNLSGAFCFEHMVAALDKHAAQTSQKINMHKIYMRQIRTMLGDIYRFFKNGKKPTKNYTDHKCSSMSVAEIQNTVNNINKTLNSDPVSVQQIAPFCFKIRAK